MIYLAVTGFALFGMVLPELCNAIGGNRATIPHGQNTICAVSMALISYGLLAI